MDAAPEELLDTPQPPHTSSTRATPLAGAAAASLASGAGPESESQQQLDDEELMALAFGDEPPEDPAPGDLLHIPWACNLTLLMNVPFAK